MGVALLCRLRGFLGCPVKAHDMAIVDAKVYMPACALLSFSGAWAALLEGLTADRPQFTRSKLSVPRADR
jgi:hypothetical protein